MKFRQSLVSIFVMVAILAFSSRAMAKTYVVGTNASFPPFEYVENGKIVGFDIDLIKAIAHLQGFKVKVRDIGFDSLIPGLSSGNLDIAASGMTITKKREKIVDFSDPYYSANQSLLVRKGSGANLTVLFGKHDIGVQTGTTGEGWVRKNLIKTGILTGKLRYYESYVYVIKDLVNGNIDGAVLDKPVAEIYSKNNPLKVAAIIITGEKYGIAVAKGNKKLLAEINAGLKKVKNNGTMEKLLQKYFKK